MAGYVLESSRLSELILNNIKLIRFRKRVSTLYTSVVIVKYKSQICHMYNLKISSNHILFYLKENFF